MDDGLRVAVGKPAEEFVVSRSLCRMSNTLHELVQCVDGTNLAVVPLPGITAEVFAKVAGYCERLDAGVRMVDELAAEYDAAPRDAARMAVLFDVIKAADYLDIQPLVEDACQVVANMIQGRSPEDIREMFGISNDLSPEEEAAIEHENRWAF
eukprot:gene17736-24096_t